MNNNGAETSGGNFEQKMELEIGKNTQKQWCMRKFKTKMASVFFSDLKMQGKSLQCSGTSSTILDYYYTCKYSLRMFQSLNSILFDNAYQAEIPFFLTNRIQITVLIYVTESLLLFLKQGRKKTV